MDAIISILFSVDYIFETSGLILVNNHDRKASTEAWGGILGNKWMATVFPYHVFHVVVRAHDIRNYVITIMTTRERDENRPSEKKYGKNNGALHLHLGLGNPNLHHRAFMLHAL